MRPGAPDAGTTFFVWTSVALRLCQLMNLHNLGDDENVMPPEDPAWPSQACSLRRELAKRIFWWSVAQDWYARPPAYVLLVLTYDLCRQDVLH